MAKQPNFAVFGVMTVAVTCIPIGAARLGWSMGTPPFDEDVRSSFSATTKQAIETRGCLSVEEAIEATSRYSKLRPREPINGKTITATFSFPGRDRKGTRIITVGYSAATNQDGEVQFSIPLGQALAEAERSLKQDRFYRGVKRVRGKINLSFSSEDTLKRSIRYVPARGLFFKMCRVETPAS